MHERGICCQFVEFPYGFGWFGPLQHDAETVAQLRELQQRVKHMEQHRSPSRQSSFDQTTASPSLQAELLQQKEELIQCLQEQLIGGRLRQAEMEAMIRDMRAQLHEHEEVSLLRLLLLLLLLSVICPNGGNESQWKRLSHSHWLEMSSDVVAGQRASRLLGKAAL